MKNRLIMVTVAALLSFGSQVFGMENAPVAKAIDVSFAGFYYLHYDDEHDPKPNRATSVSLDALNKAFHYQTTRLYKYDLPLTPGENGLCSITLALPDVPGFKPYAVAVKDKTFNNDLPPAEQSWHYQDLPGARLVRAVFVVKYQRTTVADLERIALERE